MNDLNSIQSIKQELNRVYRESHNGLIDAATGVKLAQILLIAVKIIESSELEKRIEALEAK
jgi:hypothetical protein